MKWEEGKNLISSLNTPAKMKKCVLFFALFVVALIVFKISSADSNNTPSKELVSISKDNRVAKN